MDSTSGVDRKNWLETLLWLVLIALGTGIAIKTYMLGTVHPPWPALTLQTSIAASLLYLRRGGAVTIAAWIIIILFITGFTVSAIYTGGLKGPIIPLAPFLPMLVILLINPMAGWVGLGWVGLDWIGLGRLSPCAYCHSWTSYNLLA